MKKLSTTELIGYYLMLIACSSLIFHIIMFIFDVNLFKFIPEGDLRNGLYIDAVLILLIMALTILTLTYELAGIFADRFYNWWSRTTLKEIYFKILLWYLKNRASLKKAFLFVLAIIIFCSIFEIDEELLRILIWLR